MSAPHVDSLSATSVWKNDRPCDRLWTGPSLSLKESDAWFAGLLLAAGLLLIPTAAAAPETESVYADGQTYQMVGATLVTNASPGLLAAPPLYLLGFPVAGTEPITLPSGYQPQCNPCLQEPIAFHDHLITGAPGLGTNGTSSGNYRAPWRIVIMVYTHAYAYSPDFQPVTSDDQLAAAETAGDFAVINPGAAHPYQIWTDNVLICPVVRKSG